ncbi:Stage II sporulation protein E (SpoIIE) [Abditibacterium utsteinense]|uniref:Stage II sporulation protein E (SpoIIE) n=1 Tax=Abditibacterium utsteinense TaxID=1960156 RepID=A0A2S8SXF8_9BACT|nr:PP2C family protein-serine/threonine phosphatase [Abditibacterium utsteinense]PQV65491.1 Stage II sporulation protein E (SpoIIE) [Abditibacterium utsteinense]
MPQPVPNDDAFARQDIRDVELILTAFRTLLLLVIFVVPFAFGMENPFDRREIVLMGVAGIYNIAMGVGSLFPNRFGVRRPLIVAMDTLLISAWMQFTTRWELMSFYYVVVVVAAMWYRVLGGVVAAAICDFLFLLMWGRVAADPNMQRPPVFTASMAINVVLLFVVGALAGYIAEAQERERNRRLERELLIANYQQEIDVSSQLQPLLMARFEKNQHLDLGAAMQSARGVGGGDYLDALPLPGAKTLLCIADVSGKSVRAQARVPLLKYSLRALAPLHESPAELMTRLQITLAPDLGNELYIALCLLVLDAENQTVTWCNAGHIAPLRVRRGVVLALETNSPALGLFPEIAPKETILDWNVGDALLLYTDGLADALSFGGAADGETQVQKLSARLSNPEIAAPEAAQELVDLAASALGDKPFIAKHFTFGESLAGNGARRDDVAVLIARFRGA